MRRWTYALIICACGTSMLYGASHASKMSESEIDDLIKENRELKKELQNEAKSAIEARNHAKSLFQELMKWRG